MLGEAGSGSSRLLLRATAVLGRREHAGEDDLGRGNRLGWLESRPDITSLRAAVCDLNGILRGKRVPVAQATKVLEGAMRMPYSITCLDIWGEDVTGNPLVFQQGDIDGRCEPTGRGFLPMNWLGLADGAAAALDAVARTARPFSAIRGARWRRSASASRRSG